MLIFSSIISKLNSGSQRSTNIKKNIIGSLFLKGISILVQLLLVPLTLNYLSTELYGIWLTVSSIVLWLSFFDIGFSLGLKNRLAEAIAKNDYKTGKGLVSTTYIMLISIFIPLGVILECVVPLVHWSSLLNVDTAYNDTLIDVIRILIISFVFQMVFNTISVIVAAFQKVALSNSFPVIGNVISLIIIWLLTKYTNPSLRNMALTISFVPVSVLLFSSFILFNNRLRPVKPSLQYFNPAKIKEIFSLGFKFFIIQVQVIVIQQATNLLISNVSNPDYVTYYNIAYRYIGTAMMIFTLILGPLWPAFTEAYVKKDYHWMKLIYRKLSKIYIMVLGMIVIMCILSPVIYPIWIGSTTHIPLAMTISLSVYFCLVSWDSIQITLINGIGTVKLQSYITLIGLILHIPLSLFLGRYIGAYGVVASMTFITSIYSILFTIQIRKILSHRAHGFWLS